MAPAVSAINRASMTGPRSVDDGRELPLRVARGHLLQGHGLQLRSLTRASELLVALLADLLRRRARGLQVIARVEGALVGVHVLADRRGHGEPDVRVDVHLAHAVLDA